MRRSAERRDRVRELGQRGQRPRILSSPCTPNTDLSPVAAAGDAETGGQRQQHGTSPRLWGSRWSTGTGSPGCGAGGSSSWGCSWGRCQAPGPGGVAVLVWAGSAGVHLISATMATPAGPWNPRGTGEFGMGGGALRIRGGGAEETLNTTIPHQRYSGDIKVASSSSEDDVAPENPSLTQPHTVSK